MFNQREHSLDDLLNEVHQLRERIKAVLPSYTAYMKALSQLPDEFQCRFWASCVETLLEKVRADYQAYQARAQKVDLMGKLMTMGTNIALKASGMEPMRPPNSLQVGLSIHPSGKIVPTIIDDPNRQPDAIVVTYDRFVVIVQRLKGELLKGTIMPTAEDEIPKLVCNLASKHE